MAELEILTYPNPILLAKARAVARVSSPIQRLAHHVELLILDHHLLRNEGGLAWLQRLSSETGRPVICGADFMGQPRCLLEARRLQLYEEMPVSNGWHEAYSRGEADTRRYQNYRRLCAAQDRGKVEVIKDD